MFVTRKEKNVGARFEKKNVVTLLAAFEINSTVNVNI